ncbi:TetR/AcrR family transcriptional regulator [Gracilimonas mengyeensis]|uniref:DNA-binding transcriptional regulator, AcrR family n=1 Tax=Gracilimonas mengyeensis TaxID=1302730 RepID=A0A521B4S0_9BACT|nr:TetR/AcrR family transcriptional regulator [Gracilimonas mengyeensis]SMO42065.1 DNA-binding transcriptional regulator, AcrR family [Gracilimonas mengyeensis]
MDTETFNTKIEICEAAITLYLDDAYSMPNLVNATGKTASEIYALFPSKKAILEFYYPALIIRYRAMIGEIDDFASYTISEKLSNFIFTLFDMMEEKQAFVQKTFEKFACSPGAGRDFHRQLKELFKDFFEQDNRISTSASMFMGYLFYGFLKTQYLLLVKFWIEDDSEQKARTWALTDKITGFIQELVYSKIADKGFDLAKYLLNTSGFKQQVEDLNNWVASWFEDEPEVNVDIEDEDEEESDNDSDKTSE